jgi:hypothetical protein
VYTVLSKEIGLKPDAFVWSYNISILTGQYIVLFQENCKSYGGHLAKIISDEENEYVVNVSPSCKCSCLRFIRWTQLRSNGLMV